jgi:hypothetical protein
MKNPLCRQARSKPKFLELAPTGVVPRVQFSLDVSRIEVAALPMIGQPRFHMAGLAGPSVGAGGGLGAVDAVEALLE